MIEAAALGGRFIIKEIYPSNYKEYLEIKGIYLSPHWEFEEIKNEVVKQFESYFQFGGLADTFPLNDKRSWLNSLYQKILLGDIVARNNIRNGDARSFSFRWHKKVGFRTRQVFFSKNTTSIEVEIIRKNPLGHELDFP